jgi:hypothetical protein
MSLDTVSKLLSTSASVAFCLGALALGVAPAAAQDATPPASDEQRARIAQQLEELRGMKQQMSESMSQFDARIDALQNELQPKPPADAGAAAAPSATPATPPPAAAPTSPALSLQATTPTAAPGGATQAAAPGEAPEQFGTYSYLRGFTMVSTELGEMRFNLTAYMRYLNQLGLEKTYTDSFGRTVDIDRRQDMQLAKVQLIFNGWLFTKRFNYLMYVWTSNANQGQGAQVVGAGNINYTFSDELQLFLGIHSVPTTRSTNRTFPAWLRNDNRPIADEFFRGSYTTGIWAQGTIMDGLQYRAMLANNLSTLGVDAGQLDAKINTFSAALWWMPTTHEFGGPLQGFGDYEFHDKVATLFGVHYSRSREDAEASPPSNGFENTQLRLSDGTPIFKPDAFGTGGQITKATYQMNDLNAGVKYRGWSLEGEYYLRWLNDFVTTGSVPIKKTFDHGFQLQASCMVIPKALQAYVSGSKIFGQYGNPWDLAMGFNWFPFQRKEFRINPMLLYVDRSPVGYLAYVVPVGARGWVFTTDASLNF